MSIRNRIVGTADMAIADIRLHPLNYKQHGRRQKEVLRQILGEIGWVEGVLVNKNTNTLLDGEGRVVVAKHRGETTVPVTLLDLTEAEEAFALGTLDPIADMAMPDTDKLQGLYDSLDGLSGPLLDLAHLTGALPDLSAVQEDWQDVEDGWDALRQAQDEDTDEGGAAYEPPADMTLQFGEDVKVLVDKDVFMQWRYGVMEGVGFGYADVVAELRHRLGLMALAEALL